MSNSTIALLVYIAIVVMLLAGIVNMIGHKNIQSSDSFKTMTTFHDMHSGEIQKAAKTVTEQQTEKIWDERESREGNRN